MTEKACPRILYFGIAAIITAAVLFAAGPEYAPVPLILFVGLSLAAPFFPGMQMFLYSIMHGVRGSQGVALTFDDGPDPVSTPPIIEMLDRHGIKAHFFIAGGKASRHPELIRLILKNGHTLGNHTMHHDTLIMLKTEARLEKEIGSCQDVLHSFGVKALTFRPPAGIVNPKLGAVLSRHGLSCVMFSKRGRDFGNRRIEKISANILKNIKAGDIVMLHDEAPADSGRMPALLEQMEEVITGVSKKGLDFLPLEKIIGRKVMEVLCRRKK